MKEKYLAFILTIILMFSINNVVATPSGGTVTEISSETAVGGAGANQTAIAGNITEIEIFSGNSVTQAWQGYYGNVSGGLRLADSSSNIMYNWSLASPQGEVYASSNSSITWSNVQCFNFSATGIYTDESGNGGTTNANGTNITQIEAEYNISLDDLDGINETFAVNNHDLFYTASMEFSADECKSVQLFNNESQVEDGRFEEVLLYEPATRSVIFMSILEDSRKGFNSREVDFQMMVPEDGHGADTATRPYFFFIEIE